MTTYQTIDSAEHARALAELLNGNSRTRPVVVVTIPAGRAAPWIDVVEIAKKVGDLAEIYLMPTGPHSWELSNNLPPMTQVYGGAGRVYPLGHEWASEPRRSPLRFAYDVDDGDRATNLLIDDALRMAAVAGLLDSRPASRVRRTGVVKSIIAERAVVKIDRDLGLVPDSLAFAGVPLERTLSAGMTVTGLYDAASHWFDIRESRLDPAEALSDYAVGDLVLAQVETVEVDEASLFLHPLVPVAVRREHVSSNELDDLRTLMSPGEVLTAHVVSTGPDWQLSLLDVDDDEVPLRAGSLFPGGPPWLEPPPDPRDLIAEMPAAPEPLDLPAPDPFEARTDLAPEPVVDDPGPPAPVAPSPTILDPARRGLQQPASHPLPAPGVSATVKEMSLRIAALKAQVDTLTKERDEAVTRAAAQSGDLRLTQQQLHSAEAARAHVERQLEASRSRLRRSRRPAEAVRPEFADRERGFRFEVERAWATRIPPGEQPNLPLPDYDVGTRFLDSVAALTGIAPDKIADVVMEVLTDKATHSPGRELHRLRESAAGNAPYVVRDSDGALAWRVSLQTNTPSARRLHYWELPGGRIELAKVGLHDDYSI